MPFVGEHRQAIVRDLHGALHAACDTEVPQVWTLVSPPGWGKTRIVQEFYAELASSQSLPQYWPSRLVTDPHLHALEARKRIYPGRFTVPRGAQMEWLWWGLLCGEDPSGRRLRPLWNARDQLDRHAGALVRRVQERGGRWRSRIQGVTSLLGLLGLPDPVSLGFNVADAAPNIIDELRGLWRWRRELSLEADERLVDLDSVDALAEELAHALTAISSPEFPVVLIVDDAHAADAPLVRFLDMLATTERGSILIVAAAWSHELRRQAEEGLPSTLGGWRAHRAQDHSARFQQVELEPLAEADLELVIRARAPRTDQTIIDALTDRADSNPLVLSGLLSLDVVKRHIQDDAINVPEQTIERLPRDILALYQAMWQDLPPEVRQPLALGALQGEDFSRAFVERAEEQLRLDRLSEGLWQADDPYSWIRRLDAILREFTERTLFEISYQNQQELFSVRELDAARDVLIEECVLRKESEAWNTLSDRTKRLYLATHMVLAAEGHAPTDGGAADSAARLARLDAQEHDVSAALENARRAYDWHFESVGVDEILISYGRLLVEYLQMAGKEHAAAERARDLIPDAARLFGQSNPETIRIRLDVAEALRGSGDAAKAIEEAEGVLEDALPRLAATHRQVIRCKESLALSYRSVGRYEDAVAFGEEALRLAVDELGITNKTAVRYRNNLARIYRAAGDIGRAIETGIEALKEREELLGPDHPDAITTKNNLAGIYKQNGDYEKALELGREAAEARERILGRQHRATLHNWQTLAIYLWRGGHHGEAVTFAERAYEGRLRLMGSDHPKTLSAKAALATCYRSVDRTREAIQLGEEVLAGRKQLLGPDDPDTLRSLSALAASYRAHGHVEKALLLSEEALRRRETRLGPEHLDTIKAQYGLAASYRINGRHEDAISLIERVVEQREAKLGGLHPETINARAEVGAAYRDAGHLDDARRTAERVLAERREVLGRDHPKTQRSERFLRGLG